MRFRVSPPVGLAALVWLLSLATEPTAHAQKSRKKEENTEREARSRAEAEYFFTDGMKYFITDDFAKATLSFEKSLQLAEENAATNYMMADALNHLGQTERALPYAERALRLNEDNKYYYVLLAALYEKGKNYNQAAKVYLDLLKKKPNETEYYLELASIYLYQGKYDDAVRAYEKVERSYGINEEITRQKQQILLKQNRLDDAIREGEKLVQAQPGEASPRIALAELLITNNRTERALPLLEEIVASFPENAQAHLVLSDIYRRRGEAQKADRELELAFGNPDLDADTKVNILARYLTTLTSDEAKAKALQLAEKLTRLHPASAKVHALYADLLLLREEKAKARDQYAKAARLDKATYEVWERLVVLDGQLNQLDSIVAHATQALEVFPNQATLHYYLGIAQLNQKQPRRAVETLEEGRELALANAALTTEFNAALGDAYNGTGDHARSDEAYEAVLKANPDNPYALNNYSYYLSLRKENLPRARDMARRLVEKHPADPTYLDTYAWVLYVMKDYRAALDLLEKAVALLQQTGRTNGTVLEHYGDALYQTGQPDKALEQWKKAKKQGETSAALDKKITTGKVYE